MSTYRDIWTDLRAQYEARHEPESVLSLAEIYWRLMLALAVALIIGVIMWGIWEFIGVVSALGSIPTNSGTPPMVLDRKQLEATLASFRARQTDFDALKAAPHSFADPSR